MNRRGRLSASAASVIALIILLSLGCGREERADRPSTAVQAPAKPKPESIVPISLTDFQDAALEGELNTVQQAIDQGLEVDAADSEGRTALHLASFNGHTKTVEHLLEKGAVVDRRDAAGRSALMFAATGANPETVRLLLDAGADPNLADSGERFTALMHAAAEGQSEVVQILLSGNADATLRDVDGDSALDFATRNGHREVVRLLSP